MQPKNATAECNRRMLLKIKTTKYYLMNLKTISFVASLLLACADVAADEKLPAFPGAEGYGRYTTGGRGGKVLYVTSLADDNSTGTLRWALNQSGKRTILFKVSGTIFLTSELSVNNGDVTIAGQSAPGDGICVADYPFTVNANNVIIRYMRFRLGNRHVDNHEGDGFGAMDHENIIVDHCSVSWSIDECLSVLGNRNTTVQWCISSHSLVNAGHEKGAHGYGGNWGGDHASFHHNLMIHHTSRTPRLGPRQTTQEHEYMDMRNNVIYNWAGNGCYGGEGMDVNIVNNYYKPGPATNQSSDAVKYRIAAIGIRTESYCKNSDGTWNGWYPMLHKWGHLFVEGNVNPNYANMTNDNWTYGIYNQIDANGNDGTYTQKTKDTIRLSEPLDIVYTTTHTAQVAYARVLDYVGCSKSRDSYDSELISDTRNGTASHTASGQKKGMIDSQDDLKPLNAAADWSAWPVLASAAAPVDSDGDGMPDEWESAHGLDSSDASDGSLPSDEGYTNLECYLNSLVADITAAQNVGGEAVGRIEEIEVHNPEEHEEIAEGTITWAVQSGTTGATFGKNPAVSGGIADYVAASDATVGSNLSLTSGCNGYSQGPLSGSQYLLRISCKAQSSDNTGINDIAYSVTPNDGYLFLPTGVSFLANKVGTDGGNVRVSVSNDQFQEVLFDGSPSRNSLDVSKGYNNYTSFSGNLEYPYASSGATTATVRLTSFSTSKTMSVGTVTLAGKVVRLKAVMLCGDANDDGTVTMSDANMVVNYFLSQDKTAVEGINVANADANNDGGITMADANEIVNIFLSQSSDSE